MESHCCRAKVNGTYNGAVHLIKVARAGIRKCGRPTVSSGKCDIYEKISGGNTFAGFNNFLVASTVDNCKSAKVFVWNLFDFSARIYWRCEEARTFVWAIHPI
mmetsp:Transcript_69785/g.186120  ORF Transcript_69785/g.186120 Transcript_69785/m.186120 type:complete len:103 (-) Transcript_69785:324-632(-)